MRVNRPDLWICVLVAPLVLLLTSASVAQQDSAKATVVRDSGHDLSAPLWSMPPAVSGQAEELEEEPAPRETEPLSAAPVVEDGALQNFTGPLVNTVPGIDFEGVARSGGAPPDTNGAPGDTQYMQWGNSRFAVFDKATGNTLLGPVPGSTLFSGMGEPCETNGGDGIILYDKAAGTWMFSQLLHGAGAPTSVCIAVSTTSDATGTYNRYLFDLSGTLPPGTTLEDYPKFGVWPDGYYYTANIFGQTGGTNICAFDRVSMLAGNDATAQCFFSRTVGSSYLPADVDGGTPPPNGEPNFLVDINNSGQELRELMFHVDFANPDNSTLTGPVHIPVAPFTRASGGVPQLDSTKTLDTLGDRLMFRLAYRNFGDHESLVVNHSVQDPSTHVIGVRWYELQDPNGAPFIFQQGTFMPDDTYRWMGSIAMDHAGDIALGYSASSSDIRPAIRYTGRTPDEPLGTMEDETSVLEGTGSQQPTLARWGDYSAMTIDPVDDCTFWFTTEYHQTDGSFNWNTRIASFKFPGCGAQSCAGDQRSQK